MSRADCNHVDIDSSIRSEGERWVVKRQISSKLLTNYSRPNHIIISIWLHSQSFSFRSAKRQIRKRTNTQRLGAASHISCIYKWWRRAQSCTGAAGPTSSTVTMTTLDWFRTWESRQDGAHFHQHPHKKKQHFLSLLADDNIFPSLHVKCER